MRICGYDSGESVGVFWATVATWWSKMLHLRRGPQHRWFGAWKGRTSLASTLASRHSVGTQPSFNPDVTTMGKSGA